MFKWSSFVIFFGILTSCQQPIEKIEVRCEPPKVLEDAFISCLEVHANTLNDNFKCQDDLIYYKNRYYNSIGQGVGD